MWCSGVALDWFSSYRTNKEQYVSINNVDSNPRVIQCGVPQGSILGPLLFLIFINDITKCSNQFKYILCADDSTLSTCVPYDNVIDVEVRNCWWNDFKSINSFILYEQVI